MTLLCHIDDIADESCKGFEFEDRNVFLVKKDARVYAYVNRCPHLGVELNWLEDQFLDSDGALIQCFTHGALFLIEDGECVSGPCMGQSLEPVDIEVSNGEIKLVLQ